MATRWMVVCTADTQPAFAVGNSMNCAGAGGTFSIKPVDTVISESLYGSTSIDYETFSAAFGIAFSLVITCYLVSRSVGTVLELIRRG